MRLDLLLKPGTPALLVRWSTTELSRPINIYGPSRPKYHIPPLTKFCPHNKQMFTLSRLTDLTNNALSPVNKSLIFWILMSCY